MATPALSTRPGHPDFLDLPWDTPLSTWQHERLVEVPTGVHRHVVRFVAYGNEIYAIKELPVRTARHEYRVLRNLNERIAPVALAIGHVARRWVEPDQEWSGAVITRYIKHGFPYRTLVIGPDFGMRRDQLLDAVASLLVELHLAGLFWGDCSLSNLVYRYDAGCIRALMIDAETSELHPTLTRGQRHHDLDIMTVNIAGGMADLAASAGLDIDDADMTLGADIAGRYHGLWKELTAPVTVGSQERWRVHERIARLNDLGFEIEDIDIEPESDQPAARLTLKVAVGGRTFHAARLRELTGLEAQEHQARQILNDLQYHGARHRLESSVGKSVLGIQWRVSEFEPRLAAIREAAPAGTDAVQRYCDFLHYRYLTSAAEQRDVPTEEAFRRWVDDGMPVHSPL